MIDLQALAAQHLDDVLLDTGAFGQAGTFNPRDMVAPTTGFAVTLGMGDITDQMQQLAVSRADQRSAVGLGNRAAIRAGILLKTGTERDAQHGDTWTVATGAWAGTWSVVLVQPDEGGGINLTLRYERKIEVGGKTVREIH